MGWQLDGQILPLSGATSEFESVRSFGPSVVEEDDGTLRMWYSGHDGSTTRILEAVQRPGGHWERRGVSIDIGLAGESDAYGVESPSVVFTPRGYLMAYAGSDGADTRLHMAASSDGRLSWDRRGTTLPGSGDDVDTLEERSPCVLRLRDGTLRLWFTSRPTGDASTAYNLCSAIFADSAEAHF